MFDNIISGFPFKFLCELGFTLHPITRSPFKKRERERIIAKQLYPAHKVHYKLSFQLVSLLYEADSDVIREIVLLDIIPLVPDDVDRILDSSAVAPHFKHRIKRQSDYLKQNIQQARELHIHDPDYIPFGEDLRAWKFLISERFDSRRQKINHILNQYYLKKV